MNGKSFECLSLNTFGLYPDIVRADLFEINVL